jgi:hypothetical protein
MSPLLAALLGQLAVGSDAGLSPPPPAPADWARVEAGAAEAEPEPPPERAVRVKLKDGQTLLGRLVQERPDGAVVLRLGSGALVLLAGDAVAEVQADPAATPTAAGETWFPDANRTRYLYGPSAMMLRRNEFSFSQTELVLSTFSWGATDWLSVQAGTAVPAWFIPPLPSAANFLVSVKAGGRLLENFHLAGGVQTVVLPAVGGSSYFPFLLGLGFLTATVGSPDLHASVSFALPFSSAGLGFSAPILTLSGSWRLLRGLALVTEHWVVLALSQASLAFGGGPFLVTDGLAVRIMGEHVAVDLGLLTLYASGYFVPFPIPWLTFTYNFSL